MLTARPETRALEKHYQRHLVAQCEFGQPMTLGVSARADAAGQGGEVLGADHHRRTVDQPGTGDDAVGRDVSADEGAELTKRALVEEMLESTARVELALAVVLGQPLGPAHRACVSPSTVELVERVFPVLGLGHPQLLSSEGDRRTGMFTLTILNCLL